MLTSPSKTALVFVLTMILDSLENIKLRKVPIDKMDCIIISMRLTS